MPINNRQALFAGLDPLLTGVWRALKATNAPDELKRNVKAMADDIRGMKPPGRRGPQGAAPDIDGVSTSQQSFVQRADRLRQLVTLLSTVDLYKPAAADLKVASLETLQKQMADANAAMPGIVAPVVAGRQRRDDAMYARPGGMLEAAQAVKDARTKAIRALRFDYPKTRKKGA